MVVGSESERMWIARNEVKNYFTSDINTDDRPLRRTLQLHIIGQHINDDSKNE